MTKTCRKCGSEKSLDAFYDVKSGKHSQCKACISATNKKWREQNKERKAATAKRYREENREKVKAAKKRYYEDNKDRVLQSQKEYYEKNREARRESGRRWYEANREDNLAYQKRWREENYEAYIAKCKQWRDDNKHVFRERYHRKKHDPEFKANQSMRTVLNNFLRNSGGNKTDRTHKMLGYSFDEFKAHIEKQFQRGMGWHNRHLWHIDHIVPVIEYIKAGETSPSVVNALTNLRPIWSIDNLSKGESVTHLL